MNTNEVSNYLHANNKLVTVRVNSDLYELFKVACNTQGITPSMSVREFMLGTVMAQQVAENGMKQEDILTYFNDMAGIIADEMR